MAESCDFRLMANLAPSCEEMSQSGVENTAYIVNYEDIDWDNVEYYTTTASGSTTATVHKNRVVKFALNSGAKAYKCYIPGKTPFTGTNKALAQGTYRNKFTKQVKLVVLSNGAGVSENIIDKLANGRFVVIIENTFKGGNTDKDNAFELYGLELGASATEMADDKYSEETDGGWSVTLEETNAPTSGIFLCYEATEASGTVGETSYVAAKSAYENTRSAIDALLV